MKFQTIRQFVRESGSGLTECTLRGMVKRNEVPGFRTGNRFYINVPLFEAALERIDRASATSATAQ